MSTDRGERVLDWRQELRRVTPLLNELPLAARRAVIQTVGAFLREDSLAFREAALHLDAWHGPRARS